MYDGCIVCSWGDCFLVHSIWHSSRWDDLLRSVSPCKPTFKCRMPGLMSTGTKWVRLGFWQAETQKKTSLRKLGTYSKKRWVWAVLQVKSPSKLDCEHKVNHNGIAVHQDRKGLSFELWQVWKDDHVFLQLSQLGLQMSGDLKFQVATHMICHAT